MSIFYLVRLENGYVSSRLSYGKASTYRPRHTYYINVLVFVCLYVRTALANTVDAYFFQSETEEPVYDRLFKNHPLLKTHSNKEHDNEKNYPPNPESIKELDEQIFRYVPE